MIFYAHILVQVVLVMRALLRPHREPASRIAWVVVIVAIPVAGLLAYVAFGETNIGWRRLARQRAMIERMPPVSATPGLNAAEVTDDLPDRRQPLFRVGLSVSGFAAVGGNQARLMADSDAAIDAMIADIDAATDHVHLLFYIWLADTNGMKMGRALIRAASRGVVCRAMVDDLGSKKLVRTQLWKEMGEAGVHLARALPIGNTLVKFLTPSGRIDLRNHRKILVIDNRITYCGSQNCADPEFLPKAKYGPWVDAVFRLTGPVVAQNQRLFALDWMTETGDDLAPILTEPLPPPRPGFAAQVIGTGPTARPTAMPEVFSSLFYSAREELIVTTPYYVPVDSISTALRAAANRGVQTTLILPARNDDFAVGAASRSYYADLIEAGVGLYEFQPGLLHTKSVTLDGEVTLIGSANLDCRSFALNFENNILLHDREATAAMRDRQMTYLAQSRRVTAEEVAAWSLPRQLWHNGLAILGPLL